ncbi:RNA polymerase II subunit A C-terminal domain phosphatase isoform X1 [Peromyscus californicus insignis]|uniref:RNA polymerase II subunit A C-terminal domain phosphatase isoform X1 n=1 Tax=Peromyscus californicus insignis TaxID=564181 RepID=UPI0022A79BD5|nr:RNA polymerase II subunit A C-terminal domain phosphatase isoform X1 [Peromyscus californicus insignis]
MEAPPAAGVPTEGAPAAAGAEVRCPGPTPLRLLEWKVAAGAAVRIGSVLAVCEAAASAEPAGTAPARTTSGGCVKSARAERRLRSERAGVVRELCAQPGQVVDPGALLVRLEGCSHPVVMKGLCAECGQDLTQLQNKNGKQQVPLSTATVSMVHSVPELMVSSEQAEKLGREDQQRLHRNRKLVLMVDLDQTLIHTTEQHCPQMSNKGIFHFQLGRGEPMLHTRLRPHCRDFLEKIAKLYELHVFTFGSRLYAHTIAGFLDPEKKLFSHRILSRDECIDPYSKTGNLRNLFPCGDSMVCIIDDREDVWKFAPNLITVKKYVYFPGTGDVNAPPGARESQTRKKVNHSKGADILEQALSVKDPEEGKPASGVEQSNGLGKASRELNGGEAVPGALPSKTDEKDTWSLSRASPSSSPRDQELTEASELPVSCEWDSRTTAGVQPPQGDSTQDLDFDLSSDSESSESSKSEGQKSSSASDGESEEKRGHKSPATQDRTKVPQQGAPPDTSGGRPTASPLGESGSGTHLHDKGSDLDTQEESERDSLCGLGNGCVDRKEAETESQNSEQSGVTAGESLDQSVGEEEEEDTDDDDHLIHLEEILVRVHTDYYTKYDRYLKKELEEAPDIRKIVPELKSKVLADVAVIFSGLHPTNFPVEKTREHYHATALGAKVLTQLVLSPDAPDRATHLIAARAGTEKVRQAQECKHLHVVSPDWLWSCLERWDKVEEQLFPLLDDDARAHRDNSPAAFPDRQSVLPTALFHPTPIHSKAHPGPEVRIYDSNTGKLIRMGMQGPAPAPSSAPLIHGEPSSFRAVQPHQQQMFGEELPEAQDGEQPGPARRKRQPSMSETMPLYTLCKEDLESMDKEVDDILGEGSDDSDSEKKKPEDPDTEQERAPRPRKPRAPGVRREQPPGLASSGERSTTGVRGPRGHKRKLNEEDAASESSGESSNDEEEGSSSEADEMAAALEAELNDLM